ncbi:MAG: MATE family efflux transporter, partial [Alphaproteobacteria bacterium]
MSPYDLAQLRQAKLWTSWLSHAWPTITLSIPLVIGQVAMISIWTADIVMMGLIDADSLAAGTLANRLYQPMYFIAIGLTLAVSPLTSQALGAGSRRQARRVMRQGLWIAVAYGGLTMIPMWNGEVLLLMLGQDPDLAAQADLFLKLLAPGMIPTYLYFVLRHYVSAHKLPMPPVIINLVGVFINIGLN